ncbi:helix-turn-helix domain-containing protein [Aeromicrobium sp. A1-2]|uniref:helix-turn-helix domain-containing protein n=1 Tax=Aeromicrobium sp. A1-2 TaxID=2107713 RepID=UPI001C1FD7D9|nr:helix-turn-helix domain-containing protein [Aeromicrobium sp. A1-2]
MSKARLVITALFVEHQSPSEVAARYGVHRSWVYKLKARYETEGDAALEPRSRRPKTSPTAISDHTADLVVRLRKQLSEVGLDAGPDTIAWHLQQHHDVTVSAATISRHLAKAGLVVPNHGSDRSRPTSASKRRCPTRPGNQTSPTTASAPDMTPRS